MLLKNACISSLGWQHTDALTGSTWPKRLYIKTVPRLNPKYQNLYSPRPGVCQKGAKGCTLQEKPKKLKTAQFVLNIG